MEERKPFMEQREYEFGETLTHLPDFAYQQVFRQRYNELQGMLVSIECLAIDISLIGFWKRKRLSEDSQAKNELDEVEYTARLREAEEQIHSARRIFQTLGLNDGLLDGIFRKSVALNSQVEELRNTKTSPEETKVS
ncbi:MAG: hypothetical protein AAB662_00470 [Patescibacteria group bacterium]